MTDGERPRPGGWNRIHLIVDDIDSEVARLTEEGVRFRNDVVTGPGGAQVLAVDPSGNLVELFQPAAADEPVRPRLEASPSKSITKREVRCARDESSCRTTRVPNAHRLLFFTKASARFFGKT